jgi:hypothetical protein
MPYDSNSFIQDIQVMKRALKKENFQNVNMQCNRIMSNSYLLNKKRFILPAFILRDLNMLITSLRESRSSRPLVSAAATLGQLIRRLEQLRVEQDFDITLLWESYCSSLKTLRVQLLDDNELEVYDNENTEMTKSGFVSLIDFLNKNKDQLLNRKSPMVDTTIVEMTRLYTCYGIRDEDVPLRAVMIGLGLVDDYIENLAKDEDEFESITRNTIFPFLSNLVEMKDMESMKRFETGTLVLSDIVMLWRESYLKCGEPLGRRQRFAQNYILPCNFSSLNFSSEKKEQIADLLARGIEDQLRTDQ